MPTCTLATSGTATAVWGYWVATSGTIANSSFGTTAGDVWPVWVQCGTTSGSTTATVWITWNQSTTNTATTPTFPSVYVQERISPEQYAKRAKEEEARRIKAEKRLAEEQKKREAAEERAKLLLLENLNLEQKLAYEKGKRFRVNAPSGRVYELKDGWAGNVAELDAKGKPVRRFCIHPRIEIPTADNLLAQKLLLETDEERFRKIANHTVLN